MIKYIPRYKIQIINGILVLLYYYYFYKTHYIECTYCLNLINK